MSGMAKRLRTSAWAQALNRSFAAITRSQLRAGTRVAKQAVQRAVRTSVARRKPPAGAGDWIAGVALGSAGARRYRLYRPPGVGFGDRLPLLVMLHGCGQDANSFATSTRMNRIAAREGFFVLYPEQDRLANAQGCWNWFDTTAGRAQGEAALIMNAIDQVCLLYPVDRARVAVAGLSAGASMAALLATRQPDRFKAVEMHSGIPPGTAHSTLSAVGAMHGRRATRPLPAAPSIRSTLSTPDAAWPPLLVIHGAVDRVVAPSNGEAAAQVWADATGTRAGAARSVQRGQRHPMAVTDFKQRGRTAATLVEVQGLGHAWSGGAASQPFSDSQGPEASRMVWAFAAKQFGGR